MARAINLWSGSLIVHPARRVEREDRAGEKRRVWEFARYDVAIEGMRRYLGHAGAMKVTSGVRMDLNHCEITVSVPRLSDDHDADCRRAEAFVNAVFYGDPAEGP